VGQRLPAARNLAAAARTLGYSTFRRVLERSSRSDPLLCALTLVAGNAAGFLFRAAGSGRIVVFKMACCGLALPMVRLGLVAPLGARLGIAIANLG